MEQDPKRYLRLRMVVPQEVMDSAKSARVKMMNDLRIIVVLAVYLPMLYMDSRLAFICSSCMYSSKSMYLSMVPLGVISMTRLQTERINSWSCDVMRMLPG